MAEETIFSKIVRREIPADILYQDELVTAFRDIHPRAPSHILIIPISSSQRSMMLKLKMN